MNPSLLLMLKRVIYLQGSSDPGGKQVRPGGAQQHGDHSAHHEPVQ